MLVARASALGVTVAMGVAHAGVVQVPEGGKAVAVTARGVVCGPLSGGWTIDPSDRRMVVPPPAGAANLARTLDVKIADAAGCAASKEVVTLVAMGPWPELDATAVTFWPDDGRIELKGQRLEGAQIGFAKGSDACLGAQGAQGKVQTCAIPIAPGLPADAPLQLLPAYARFGADVTTFDAQGHRVDADAMRLRPAKIVLSKPLVQPTGIDVVALPARVVLAHPEAVTSVDCGSATCELAERGVLVRAVHDPQTAIAMRLRLAPRVFASKGDALVDTVTTQVPLLACPMTVVAGTVVRDVDHPSAVARMDPNCGRDPSHLRWVAGGSPAELRKVVKTGDGIYVVLGLERTTAERVTIVASRPDLDNTIVALATESTVPLPQPRVTLELPGHGKIDFVPTNRAAVIAVASAGSFGRLVPISVDGAYVVAADGGQTTIRAAASAEGFVALRLAYRVPSLPGELAAEDLAVATEQVQRAMREAAVPAPIGADAYAGASALVELICGETRVKPGTLYRIPTDARASCRVVLHQERLAPADGSQELTLEVEVTKADGTPRADAKRSDHLVLHPGGETRVVAIKSALSEFDRVDVRVSHVIDESHYVGTSAPGKTGFLAAQWSAIVEGGRLRLYATATIPAGLYRVNTPSGQLTLNFGVLSRLTTLSRTGKEGLIGLELGLMGVGLAPQSGTVTFPRTLALVAGLGLRVPLGQGATIGIDGWVAYELHDGPIVMNNTDGTQTEIKSNWSFIFGPSISFGNVGINL